MHRHRCEAARQLVLNGRLGRGMETPVALFALAANSQRQMGIKRLGGHAQRLHSHFD